MHVLMILHLPKPYIQNKYEISLLSAVIFAFHTSNRSIFVPVFLYSEKKIYE